MIKAVIISDTHNRHDLVSQGEGDLLLHAGDLTSGGTPAEAQIALDWLAKQKQYYTHVVFTAGNHDYFFQYETPLAEQIARELGIHYLQQREVVIEGLNIWGSPITPNYGSMAFNADRGQNIRRIWEQIPMDVDILLTHSPPMYMHDRVHQHGHTRYTGCEDLANHVQHRKPVLHCFGHIHEQYGFTTYNDITFVNASVLDETYTYKNEPVTAYLERIDDKWTINKIHKGLTE